MSPSSPSLMRLNNSPRARLWRHIRPTPTLRFFFLASSFRASMRLAVMPSGQTGFSMNTFRPRSIAFL